MRSISQLPSNSATTSTRSSATTRASRLQPQATGCRSSLRVSPKPWLIQLRVGGQSQELDEVVRESHLFEEVRRFAVVGSPRLDLAEHLFTREFARAKPLPN